MTFPINVRKYVRICPSSNQTIMLSAFPSDSASPLWVGAADIVVKLGIFKPLKGLELFKLSLLGTMTDRQSEGLSISILAVRTQLQSTKIIVREGQRLLQLAADAKNVLLHGEAESN